MSNKQLWPLQESQNSKLYFQEDSNDYMEDDQYKIKTYMWRACLMLKLDLSVEEAGHSNRIKNLFLPNNVFEQSEEPKKFPNEPALCTIDFFLLLSTHSPLFWCLISCFSNIVDTKAPSVYLKSIFHKKISFT